MPMNPFRWSFRARMLLAAAACFALIGFAIYSQFAWGLKPCPLCIFQRIAFAALGVVLLLAGLSAPKGAAGRRAWACWGWSPRRSVSALPDATCGCSCIRPRCRRAVRRLRSCARPWTRRA